MPYKTKRNLFKAQRYMALAPMAGSFPSLSTHSVSGPGEFQTLLIFPHSTSALDSLSQGNLHALHTLRDSRNVGLNNRELLMMASQSDLRFSLTAGKEYFAAMAKKTEQS